MDLKNNQSVLSEQVKHIYNDALVGIVSTLSTATILFVYLRHIVSEEALLVWYSVLVMVSLIRFWFYFKYRQKAKLPEQVQFWRNIMLAGLALTGITWASALIFIFPENSILHQALMITAIVGLLAGSLSTYSGLFAGYIAFSLPSHLVLPFRLFTLSTEVHTALGILSLIYLFLSFVTAHRINKFNIERIVLNIDFGQKVMERTEKLALTNTQLENEIIQRQKTEKILRESEERFRNISAAAHDAIVMINDKGNITYWNSAAEKIFGYNSGEILDINLHKKLAPPRYWQQYEKGFEAFVNTGKATNIGKTMELTALRKDGKEIPIELSLACTMINDRWNAIGLVRDISERKANEVSLRKARNELEKRVHERTHQLEIARNVAENANQAKSQFLANMSHELRTPLNHIIGFTELLLEKHFGDLNATQEEYLNDVAYSSRHLLSLINDILDLSKVESGKMVLELSQCIIGDLLANSMIMIKEKALRHCINLKTKFIDLPESIIVDERKLKQILYNLLSNAVKYTPDKGTIKLQAKVLNESQMLEISVSDTGIGIKKDDLQKIFTPFEQIDSNANRKYDGTGLGLSLSQEFVHLHGGKIWAESNGKGQGSRFIFHIPLHHTAIDNTKEQQKDDSLPTNSADWFILP